MHHQDPSSLTPLALDAAPRPSVSPAKQAALDDAAHDFALVMRFKAGDEAAFVEISERYKQKLFNVAFRILRDESDAEEIRQDALIRAYRGLKEFRGEASLSTWMYRVAANLALNRHWHRKRRGAGKLDSFDAELWDAGPTLAAILPDSGPTPAEVIAATELEALIAAGMDRLEPQLRDLLQLVNEQELSYEAIGLRTNAPLGTVKSRIARARRHLAGLVAEISPEVRTFETFRQPAPLPAATPPLRRTGPPTAPSLGPRARHPSLTPTRHAFPDPNGR